MMYSRFGLTPHQSADLAKCAEAAQLAIQADLDRRAKLKAEQDEEVRQTMAEWMCHLKFLPTKNKPPKTSFYSE
jgi:hypothetical protein